MNLICPRSCQLLVHFVTSQRLPIFGVYILYDLPAVWEYVSALKFAVTI
jgi:hypothetical protein